MAFRGATFLLFVNWLCIVMWLTSTMESSESTVTVIATNDTYITRTAGFGPRIPEEGLLLNVIAVESLDPTEETTACHGPIPAPKDKYNPWVALVERGGECTFAQKVRNMQQSGAQAVIVGDNQKNGLVTMYAREDTSDITVPSVFITQNHYRELQYFSMDLGQGFAVLLMPDEEDWPILDAVMFVILSPAFAVLFMFFLWKMRERRQRLADLAPPEVVSNLPVKVFFKSKVEDNDAIECVICLEEYVDEDELRILPCKHEYHVACIDKWLITRKKFCPTCKRDICAPSETTPLLGSGMQPDYASGSSSNGNTSASANSFSSTASLASPTLASTGAASEQDDRPSEVIIPVSEHPVAEEPTAERPSSSTEEESHVLNRV
ncbi:hypothetical protein EMPS_03564 [Entomortierella parvispora]|uniref:RING-type domain-containing protein n=1 Tax=Entomortierella parvispora TaxID=205924 RepID=A0A9P3LUR8_9FUNG|nr:hypothetical protein EMPS_03564 [Entomortierella parvispora]